MKNDLCVAFLLESVTCEGLDFPIYLATRPIVGYANDKRNVFIEEYSCATYLSIDDAHNNNIPEGFGMVIPIKKLLKEYKTLNIKDVVAKSWFQIENYIYFFEDEGLEFKCATKEAFESKFNVSIPILSTNDINELNLRFVNGDISKEEYQNILYPLYDTEIRSETDVNIKLPNINETIDKVKSRIIGQDETVKKVVTSIYKSIIFGRDKFKSNILMYGPTGVGKTAIVKSIGEILNIPVVREDMTRFTETGYVGRSADDILIDLYNNANGDLALAENSILFLDEIDKKVDNGNDKSFNKEDVLNSLLTIIEGGKYDISVGNNTICFDTSKLIVIMSGAFSNLYKEIKNKKSIGFSIDTPSEEVKINNIESKGMPSEFVGRLSLITRLNSLDMNDLINILKKGELSSLRKYLTSFKELGIDVKFNDKLYENIAKKASMHNKGARVLNLVTDEVFENVVFSVLSNEDVKEVVLGDNIVDNNTDYKLIRKSN